METNNGDTDTIISPTKHIVSTWLQAVVVQEEASDYLFVST